MAQFQARSSTFTITLSNNITKIKHKADKGLEPTIIIESPGSATPIQGQIYPSGYS